MPVFEGSKLAVRLGIDLSDIIYAPEGILEGVTSVKYDYDNSLDASKVIGSNLNADIKEGTIHITGTVEGFYQGWNIDKWELYEFGDIALNKFVLAVFPDGFGNGKPMMLFSDAVIGKRKFSHKPGSSLMITSFDFECVSMTSTTLTIGVPFPTSYDITYTAEELLGRPYIFNFQNDPYGQDSYNVVVELDYKNFHIPNYGNQSGIYIASTNGFSISFGCGISGDSLYMAGFFAGPYYVGSNIPSAYLKIIKIGQQITVYDENNVQLTSYRYNEYFYYGYMYSGEGNSGSVNVKIYPP